MKRCCAQTETPIIMLRRGDFRQDVVEGHLA